MLDALNALARELYRAREYQDAELVVRAQNGDREAFADLVRAGAGRLYAVAYRILRDVALAEDAVQQALLDTWQDGVPGGTGKTFDWALARRELALPVVLAGGLTAENVGQAMRTVRPAAVDVSGGVESAPGVKDHDRIRRFIAAVGGGVWRTVAADELIEGDIISLEPFERAVCACHSLARPVVRLRVGDLHSAPRRVAFQVDGTPAAPRSDWRSAVAGETRPVRPKARIQRNSGEPFMTTPLFVGLRRIPLGGRLENGL